MFLLTRFFFVSFSLLVAAQILPEVDPENAYQRLRVALDNHDEQVVLSIIITEQDSLKATQKGVNLAIKACAIYGDIELYNGFCEPRLRTHFCCIVRYDSNAFLPNDQGAEAAYVEAVKCQRGINFIKQIPLPADSKVRRLIYKRAFDELVRSENANDYLSVLFYLADHLEDANATDSLKRNFVVQHQLVAPAILIYAVSAQSFNDSDDDL